MREGGECLAEIACASCFHQIAGNAMSDNLAAVQNDDAVTLRGLVYEVGCPKHAGIVIGGKIVDMPENIAAGFNVEANGWLIEKEQSRAMKQRTGNFHTPHLSAGQISGLIMGPVLQLDAPEEGLRTQARFMPANSMQRGVIVKVLDHREIQVEGPCLKDGTQQAEGGAWIAAEILPKNANLALLSVEKPGNQGKKRALSSTVEPQKYNEFPQLY